jgi:hypothetical protein
MKLSIILSGVLVGTSIFVGCGGSNGAPSAPTLKVGHLIDSPIEGVSYECGEIHGKTDSSGKFSCKAVPVTFKVGGWVVGKLNKFTSDGKVYPQDLVGVPRDNFTDSRLINLTRMLQSLDDDGDISKSIKITPEAHAKLRDATGSYTLVQLADVLGRSAVSAHDAISHLKGSMPAKDAGGKGGGDSGNQGGGSDSSWVPVTSNFTCDPAPTTMMGYNMDKRYAADGNIKVACKTTQAGGKNYTFPEYSLDGVEQIEITQMKRVEMGTGKSDKYGSYSFKEEYDFKAGTVHIVEKFGSTNMNCIETYPTNLPIIVSSGSELEDLVEMGFNAQRLGTTCPDSYYEKGDASDDDNEAMRGTFTETIDLVIKDSQGKTHKISTEEKVSK